MLKAQIAKLTGENASTWSHYIRRGVIEPPPDNYKKMNKEDLKEYIELCKRDIMAWRSAFERTHYKINQYNKDRSWRLPPIYEQLEKELTQYGY